MNTCPFEGNVNFTVQVMETVPVTLFSLSWFGHLHRMPEERMVKKGI